MLHRLLGSHLELDFGDGEGRVETLRAGPSAVEDCMTPIKTHLILQLLLPLGRLGIPRIRNPPISLHQRRRTQILVLIPPIAGATRRATSAENTFV